MRIAASAAHISSAIEADMAAYAQRHDTQFLRWAQSDVDAISSTFTVNARTSARERFCSCHRVMSRKRAGISISRAHALFTDVEVREVLRRRHCIPRLLQHVSRVSRGTHITAHSLCSLSA